MREEIAYTRTQVSQANAPGAAIFDVHLLLLDDAELLDAAQLRINAGIGPARAWSSAYTQVERMFSDLPDPYLRARAADVRAVGEQVLHHLVGPPPPQLSGEGILIAAELTPVEVANLDLRRVHGVVLAGGSVTSHAAILARSRGIPMLVAAGPDVLSIEDGTPLVVDANDGILLESPPEDLVAAYTRQVRERLQAEVLAKRAAAGPAITQDGVQVAVLANVASIDDARAAVDAHADGVGLVRTEFLFRSGRSRRRSRSRSSRTARSPTYSEGARSRSAPSTAERTSHCRFCRLPRRPIRSSGSEASASHCADRNFSVTSCRRSAKSRQTHLSG